MCSRSSCSSCSEVDECGWCANSNAAAVGDCISLSEAETCSSSLVTEQDKCPSVGEDVSLHVGCFTTWPVVDRGVRFQAAARTYMCARLCPCIL